MYTNKMRLNPIMARYFATVRTLNRTEGATAHVEDGEPFALADGAVSVPFQFGPWDHVFRRSASSGAEEVHQQADSNQAENSGAWARVTPGFKAQARPESV